jgi:predicted dehydrogenase
LGNWSRQIFQAVGQLSDVKISHCYSRYPETREAFASDYECLACDSYEQMMDDPDLDGVVVMSSNVAHENDVMLAAEKGKHVFVTKPIATTIAAGQRMIAACEEHDVILGVEHQTRREPALRKLKEILETGELGDVRLVEANYSTPNGLKMEEGNWRGSQEECPGGALIQIGIHVIDTLQYLLGPMERVFSWQANGGLKVDIAGVTSTLLTFESGLQGYLGSSYVSSFAHWVRIYGSKKNAFYSELVGLTITEDSWEEGIVRNDIAPPAIVKAPMPAIVEEISEFVQCIRTGDRPEIGGEAALHNLAVVLAAVESDKLQAPVTIASIVNEPQAS